ncbi:MAG TPA: YebC/PmpR family DNA-binding transcriptional regulator [Synergistaceae bacterium]|nr:YebC/PmpR family DNA-binding transcriptional regulator [Synergistaceae bacterium]NLL41354.1 YebC/PmpR family DNA-binding transcriptional regulator [Synergistaceae bacterium]HPX03391.1 YebC/PmpR family DNA-binding transcriptional regulator [Synergistaceae bacterium]HQA54406.1 YebC/PmpR family DNA-binding transcriptional regulator [Synergistaceae bacterium]
MSGHSKWANIKHRKAAQDSKKGVAFQKLVKNVIAAAKAGGGDPNSNFRLKVAIERARAGNVPVDNIERGIKRATGELDGVIYEEILYEGYGPNGVAIMVQALTDNRNRTAPEMRSLFTKTGGSIGEVGCVAWNFERKGIIGITGSGIDEDEIMMAAIEAGADDVTSEDDGYEITCDPSVLSDVAEALKNAGYNVESIEVEMVPKNTVSITNKADAAKLLSMVERFEEHDDVQAVYANFDIPDEILAEIDG